MAKKYSTGMVMGMASDQGIKEILDDFVIRVYGGVSQAPTTADAAVTGTLLAEFSKDGAAITGTASTRQVDHVVVTRGSTNDTFSFIFTVPSKTLVYTQTAGDTTNDILATSMAAAINADTTLSPVVEAISVIGDAVTESIVYLRAKYRGEPYALTVDKTGGGTIALTSVVANARINSLHLYIDTNSNASKETAYTWLATGLAGEPSAPISAVYYRAVKLTDTGTLSTTEPRVQGDVSTSGAELNLQPTTAIITGQPLGISTFSLPIKKTVV